MYYFASVAEKVVPRDVAIWGLLVALVGILAFARSAGFSFVYDDHWTIEQNHWLKEPLGTVFSALLDGTANGRGIPDATRPAMVASLWVDRHLFALRPFGFHVHSILLYGVACAGATSVSFALLEDRRAAVFSSFFFALAPNHAEVVSAVNYREDLIAAIGMLVPLAWLFRPAPSKDSVGAGLLVAAVALFGLCGKESAMFLLPLVFAVALVRRVDGRWIEARERTLWFIVAATLLWLNWRLALAVGPDGIPRAPRTDAWTRSADTARYALRSLAAAFVPLRPSPEYANPGAARAAWHVALVAVVGATAYFARRARLRPVALGLLIAVIAPLGSSPLFRPINPWADRYAFVAVLGGGVALGHLAATYAASVPRGFERLASAGLALAAFAACIASERVWSTDRTLWTYAVERAPTSARAWAALSRVERLSGNLDDADRFVERAIALKPSHVPAHVTRVYNLLARGDVARAREEIARVEQLGGAAHPAIRHARACASGGAEEAKRCIGGGG